MELSNPQGIYLNNLNTKFRAYVGGYGSGKTFVGCLDLIIFMMENPSTVTGYFAPTYPQIRDIFYPTFEEAANMLGFQVVIKYGDKEIILKRGGVYYGTVICRSMDNPASIVGFKIARALVDEVDTLGKDKAADVWNKIIARLRLVINGVQNSIGVTTTPEGFRFVYQKFAKDPSRSYSMVQASSYENEKYLPDDYIPSLLETYTPELVKAYVGGQFVNMTSGSVYSHFNRGTCNSSRVIKDGEPLHIGMDFNVRNMAAVVFVKDGYDRSTAVDEMIGYDDTHHIIKEIKERYTNHRIYIYPDASGVKTSSSSGVSVSDISLLRDAGFTVKYNKQNPKVRDRVVCVDTRFYDNTVKVNIDKCKTVTECLEQQAYNKQGEPDKTSGNDHTNDAFGYYVAYEHKIKRQASRIIGR